MSKIGSAATVPNAKTFKPKNLFQRDNYTFITHGVEESNSNLI